MKTRVKRFYDFLKKDIIRSILSFALYFSTILWCIVYTISSEWADICVNSASLVVAIAALRDMHIVYGKVRENKNEKISDKVKRKVKEIKLAAKREIKKIIPEIKRYIPVLIISAFIYEVIIVGEPVNQIEITEMFYHNPFLYTLLLVIAGPLIEEFLCRVIPYQFIKNKVLYIVISGFVFAAGHVVGDPKASYYILAYLIESFYFGYRYYETKDIWVTFSLHSFANFIAVIPLIISCFQ